MAEKENNHYVPRLLLRKFDERISVYNLKSKELKLNQKLDNVFASNRLYSMEIENMFNDKVENEFAHLLNRKILSSENSLVLTRKEVNLVKKFLLLAMLRTMESETYVQMKADKLRDTVKINYKFIEKPDISAMPSFDYWMQTLRCILEAKNPIDVRLNESATAIAVYWANTFISGYIAIWDSSESREEFVIMDQGMTSEHEITRFLPQFNHDMIKRGYLFNKLMDTRKPTTQNEINKYNKYTQLALANDSFSENMYLFTLSKNRMIAFINPFFRLYDEEDWNCDECIEIPDIWTTFINDKRLFEKNKNEYIVSPQSVIEHSEDDKFIYKVHSMNIDDVIYINCLVLDRIHTYLGFAESKGILRSLNTYSCVRGAKNNYDSLLRDMQNLGYVVGKSRKYLELASKISPSTYIFSESEQVYITQYLKMKDLVGK